MSDILEAITIHNEDANSHTHLINIINEKAQQVHLHLSDEIGDFVNRVIQIVEADLIDDLNYEDNKNRLIANLKVVSQALLFSEIENIKRSTAEKIHTHLKEDITDFSHNHEEYITYDQLINPIPGMEGASLVGANVPDFAGGTVQELLNELRYYSDENRNNFFVKKPVRAIATSHISSLVGVRHNIDGIEIFRSGDRVLLVGQNDNRENGIYTIRSEGWTRADDMYKDSDLAANIIVFINEGLEYVNTGWRLEIKSNDIGGVIQPLKIGEVAILGKPFSYNRNLRSSNTIELTVDNSSNVLMPELKIVMGDMPVDAVFSRIQCDRYGRVIYGELLGPHGNDYLLEDYNIRDALTAVETIATIEEALKDFDQGLSVDLAKIVTELKAYTDSGILSHNNSTNVHSALASNISDIIHNSTKQFKHNHNDLYYTKSELESDQILSGAELIGVNSIQGIDIPNGTKKTVQRYLEALKTYVDSIAQSLDIKDSVYVATTLNIGLSGLQVIDGIQLATGNRVLVKDQIDKKANGIYIASIDNWQRAEDANTGDKLTAGSFVFIEHGDTWKDTGWVMSTHNPVVIDTSEIHWTQFSHAGVIESGQGLSMEGTTIYMPSIFEEPTTFTKVKVDVTGKVIEGSNPTTLEEFGITEVYNKLEIDSLLNLKANLDIASASKNGLMSKEDYIKLNGIETGAEKNQNAYSGVELGAVRISATQKQSILSIILGNGINGSLDNNSINLAIGDHDHKWKDLTDAPTSLPADGGNADSIGGFGVEDIAFREEFIGSGSIGIDINPEINEAIDKHNIDINSHSDIRNKLKDKADLVNGKVPIEQIPISLNLGPAKTAIVGANGNWWYYDQDLLEYVDSGIAVSSSKASEAITVNSKGPSDGNIDITYSDLNKLLIDTQPIYIGNIIEVPAATDSIIIGNKAQAMKKNSITIGTNSFSDLDGSIAIGTNANINYTFLLTGAIAIGENSSSTDIGVAIGKGASVKSGTGVALGSGAISYNYGIGIATVAYGSKSIAIGEYAGGERHSFKQADFKHSSISIGTGSAAVGMYSIALGSNVLSGGTTLYRGGIFGPEGPNYYSFVNNHTIGIGFDSKAVAENTIAVGHKAKAIGIGYNKPVESTEMPGLMDYYSYLIPANDAIAIGTESKILSPYSISIGYKSQAGSDQKANDSTEENPTFVNSSNAISIGANSQAFGQDSIAFGSYNKAFNFGSIAIGSRTTIGTDPFDNTIEQISSHSCIAIGRSIEVYQNTSIAIGQSLIINGESSIVIGHLSEAHSTTAIVIGKQAKVQGTYQSAIAIGTASLSESQNALSLGTRAKSYGFSSVAIGDSSIANGSSSISIGNTAKSEMSSIAIGNNAKILNGDTSIAVGENSSIYGTDGIAIGRLATIGTEESSVNSGIAIGKNAKVLSIWGIAIGDKASATSSIGIGLNANASGIGSISLGSGAKTPGDHSIAIGDEANTYNSVDAIAIGLYATTGTLEEFAHFGIAIGKRSAVNGQSVIAIGESANANGKYSTALGYKASTLGEYSTALGQNANAIGNGSTALGSLSTAEGEKSIAFGTSKAIGNFSIACGPNNNASGKNSVVLGYQVINSGDFGIALGSFTEATNHSTIAISTSAKASGNKAIAIGGSSIALGDWSLALGSSTEAAQQFSIAIGKDTKATGESTISLGDYAISEDYYSIALGSYAQAPYLSSIAIGREARSGGVNGIAIGRDAITGISGGHYGVAIGSGSSASSNSNVALGDSAIADGESSIALGGRTKTIGGHNIVLGYEANTSKNWSIAIGSGAKATAIGSIAIGYQTSATGDYSIALGMMANNTISNSIFLGDARISSLRCQVTTITALSDTRIKENIEPANLDLCIEAVKSLPITRYKYKDFVGNYLDSNVTGWLADDVEKVFPKSVTAHDQKFYQYDKNGEAIEAEIEDTFYEINPETGEAVPYQVTRYEHVYKIIKDCKDITMTEALPTLWGAVQKLITIVEEQKLEIEMLKQNK